jgi:hypothetical protein
MQRKYFAYLHERDYYDLYIFKEELRSVSNHFIIDFDDGEAVLSFLMAVEDGSYPQWIIIDLYDWQQVKALISKLRRQEQVPLLPVLVLRDRSEDLAFYQNVELFRRPKNRTTWEALVQKITQ